MGVPLSIRSMMSADAGLALLASLMFRFRFSHGICRGLVGIPHYDAWNPCAFVRCGPYGVSIYLLYPDYPAYCMRTYPPARLRIDDNAVLL
ncbi:hypothetical protein F4777DRAFT_573102 [Nemania sp. FL0916]|nr:hypothetical protein F4777DRAFT_573102 [Nemania sp. FL0916]